MKKSSVVALVISGALYAGCDSSDNSATGRGDSQTYTNNHYAAGRGYYHAPFHGWYPFPYNYFDPARGYYHGGAFQADPHVSSITASQPAGRRSPAGSASSAAAILAAGLPNHGAHRHHPTPRVAGPRRAGGPHLSHPQWGAVLE